MPAYIIISANGQGNRQDDYDHHRAVWGTIPPEVQISLEMTDNHDAEDDEEFTETKWVGELTDDQWYAFRDAWMIEPDKVEPTMGMITELGHLPAVKYTSDGTDWNVGGVYPVSWVDVYLCTDDPDFTEHFN